MRNHVLATAIAALSLSGAAIAHEAGDVILRVGVVHASPDVSSSKIKVEGYGSTVKVPESSIDVKSGTAAGLTGTYMIMPHFGLEASITTPFSHKVKGKAMGESFTIGKVSRLSPTISAQFFFLNPKSAFQPYVGLGVNYTMFYDEKLHREMKEDGAKNFTMSNSVGVVAQIGMDYKITKNLSMNAAVWRMGMSSTVKWRESDPPGDDLKAKADVDINPWVYTLGVGFRF